MAGCVLDDPVTIVVNEDVTNVISESNTIINNTEENISVVAESSTNIIVQENVTNLVVDRLTLEGTVTQPGNALLILSGTICFDSTSNVKLDGTTTQDVSAAFTLSGTTTFDTGSTVNINGVSTQGSASVDTRSGTTTFDENSKVNIDGSLCDGGDLIELSTIKDMVNDTAVSSIRKIDAVDIGGLIVPDFGANTVTVTGGDGHVIVLDATQTTGVSIRKAVRWEGGVIDWNTVTLPPGVAANNDSGNVNILIDENGAIVLSENRGLVAGSRENTAAYIQVGYVTLFTRFLVNFSPVHLKSQGFGFRTEQVANALGAFAYANQGPTIEGITGTLGFKFLEGYVISYMSTGLSLAEQSWVSSVFTPAFPSADFIVDVSPRSGEIVFNVPPDLDPNSYEAADDFIDVTSVMGGASIRIQSSSAMRPNTGDLVTIANSTELSYNGVFTVANTVGNDRFDLNIPFVSIATGDWRAITEVTASNWTIRRIFNFGNFVAAYWSLNQYTTQENARASRLSEGFIEATITTLGTPEVHLIIMEGTTDVSIENTTEVEWIDIPRIRL